MENFFFFVQCFQIIIARVAFAINIHFKQINYKFDSIKVENLPRKNIGIFQNVLFFNEMYLQNCAQDSGKEPIGEDNDIFSPLDL